MRRARLTEEEKQKIVEMFAQGLSQNYVSRFFNVDRSSVRYHLAKANVHRPGFSITARGYTTGKVREPRVPSQPLIPQTPERIRQTIIDTFIRNMGGLPSESLIQSTMSIEIELVEEQQLKPKTYLDYLYEDYKRRGVAIDKDELRRKVQRRKTYGV